MFPKAIACLLASLTLLGPGLCCCSLGEATEWVFAGVFTETGIPQPSHCCHGLAGVNYRNGNRDGCHSKHARDSTARTSHTCGQSNSEQSGESPDCPCREEGADRTGGPSTLTSATSSASAPLDAAPNGYVIPTAHLFASADAVTKAAFSAPKGVCEDGQGILRAYSRLRI